MRVGGTLGDGPLESDTVALRLHLFVKEERLGRS